MNYRFIAVALAALALSPILAACGSEEEPAKEPTYELSGVYRPADQGAIGSITFSGDARKDYLLMPTGCAGGGCAEIGTYHLDVPNKVLRLEDAKTHQTRTIALEVMKTTPASSSLVKSSITPLDLTDPGTQLSRPGQVTGGGSQKVTGDNGGQQVSGNETVTGAVAQLLQVIAQALMNGQQMKQDAKNDDAKADPMADPKADPKDDPKKADCQQNVPTKDTPLAQAIAYFVRCPGGP